MDNQERIFELEVSILQSNPLQPRGIISPESLSELVDSIREQGILEPLVVAKTPAGYQIIAGERRWRAAKILGLSKVPVVIRETTPQGMLEMSIVENVQREDLNPIERALAFKRLIEEFGLGTNEVAKRVGKSAPTVSNTIRLLSLPDAIKDALVAGVITEGHVRPLISLGDSKLMIDLFKKILRENSNVRKTEEFARQIKSEVEKKEPRTRLDKMYIAEQEELAKNVIEKLKQKFGEEGMAYKVRIDQTRALGRIILEVKADETKTMPIITNVCNAILNNLQGENVKDQS